jgi:hypothetical protein
VQPGAMQRKTRMQQTHQLCCMLHGPSVPSQASPAAYGRHGPACLMVCFPHDCASNQAWHFMELSPREQLVPASTPALQSCKGVSKVQSHMTLAHRCNEALYPRQRAENRCNSF